MPKKGGLPSQSVNCLDQDRTKRLIGVTAHWTPVGMERGADWSTGANQVKRREHTHTHAHSLTHTKRKRENHEINIFLRFSNVEPLTARF